MQKICLKEIIRLLIKSDIDINSCQLWFVFEIIIRCVRYIKK